MHGLHKLLILIIIVLSLIKIIRSATFYEEEYVEITQESVVKRMSGISRSTCILRCRRNADCLVAAIDDFDCLFLKNESGNVSNGKEMTPVKILKEVNTKKKPPGIMILL